MNELLTALGLVLVIEGALYALFPGAMKRAILQALTAPLPVLRYGGLFAAIAGVLIVWFVRG